MTDVVVIGGGIVGCAVAAHLAAAGRRVTLVERTAIAAGASGRNSGVVQHPFDPVLIELHERTLALYRALPPAAGIDFELPGSPAGLLMVAHDGDALRAQAAALAASHPTLRAEYLAPGEVSALEPVLGPDVAAVRLAIGYPVSPDVATHAYAAWAGSLGVELRIGQGARLWPKAGAHGPHPRRRPRRRIAHRGRRRRRGRRSVESGHHRSQRRLAAHPGAVGRRRPGHVRPNRRGTSSRRPRRTSSRA